MHLMIGLILNFWVVVVFIGRIRGAVKVQGSKSGPDLTMLVAALFCRQESYSALAEAFRPHKPPWVPGRGQWLVPGPSQHTGHWALFLNDIAGPCGTA